MRSDPKNFAHDKKNLGKKFEQINSLQISDSERKKMADFVIYNNGVESITKLTNKVVKLCNIL